MWAKWNATIAKPKWNGNYELPLYLKLSREDQDFILDFFLTSGSIKEMASKAGNSYPTMRNKMDDLIEKIKNLKWKKLQ